MSCYYPLQALDLGFLTENGKKSLRILKAEAALQFPDKSKLVQLPCSRCVGCRLERSRQWAVRCEKEIQTAESKGLSSCFITLTFDDEGLKRRNANALLPLDSMTLVKKDFQDFMKRLRKRFGSGIRFYHCGEYGEMFQRPHYHAIIFGFDFPDKKLWKMSNGVPLYVSDVLSDLWPYGFSSVGTATFESAAYVARYIMKKHLGKDAHLFYDGYLDEETGEIIGHRIPEYTTMSRRSGIGKEWLDKYLLDVYPSDSVYIRGKGMKCKPPRYYDSQYEIQYPSDFSSLKQARVQAALKHSDDNTRERLDVRQKVLTAKLKSVRRSNDNC